MALGVNVCKYAIHGVSGLDMFRCKATEPWFPAGLVAWGYKGSATMVRESLGGIFPVLSGPFMSFLILLAAPVVCAGLLLFACPPTMAPDRLVDPPGRTVVRGTWCTLHGFDPSPTCVAWVSVSSAVAESCCISFQECVLQPSNLSPYITIHNL